MDREPIKKTSRIAVVSIYCVLAAIASIILSCFFTLFRIDPLAVIFIAGAEFFFCAGFVLGLLSLAVIIICRKRTKGLLWAILSILLSVVPMYFIVGVWLGSKARAELGAAHVGTYNLRILGKEMIKYSENHNGYLPVDDQWCDALMKNNLKLSEANFRHPQSRIVGLKGECHFAFNRSLSGMRLADIPGDVVLVFEADGDWNLNGTDELLKTRYREQGYITIFFANGKMSDYWFYKSAIRKFDKRRGMYYEQARWNP